MRGSLVQWVARMGLVL